MVRVRPDLLALNKGRWRRAPRVAQGTAAKLLLGPLFNAAARARRWSARRLAGSREDAVHWEGGFSPTGWQAPASAAQCAFWPW